jgi:hypothetical protein
LRVLSQLNSQLSAADRAEIVTSLVYYIRPRAILNVDSAAAWQGFAERGGALAAASRLFATNLKITDAPNLDRKSALRDLTGLYVVNAENVKSHDPTLEFDQQANLAALRRWEPLSAPEHHDHFNVPGAELYFRR